MATYLVEPDTYAGWHSTGRNFALIGAGVGAIGLLSWMSLNRHLGAFRPNAASDQIFLAGLVWLGVGGFSLMAFAAMGSILLSLRSRGAISITEAGVSRTVDRSTRSLAWSEIQGLVPMPYGGVTLVAAASKLNIVIPRFLDDYRACIAEIKAHSIPTLPPGSLRPKPKTTWLERGRLFCFIFCYTLATSAHESHRVRIASFTVCVALAIWLLQSDQAKADQTSSRWIGGAVFLGILLLGLRFMTLNW